MPSSPRSWSTTTSGAGVVVEITIMAVAVSGLGPTAMDEMETPAAPERRPHDPDHARAVVVAHDEHVGRRRHLHHVVVDDDDARLGAQAGGDQRAGDGVRARAQA